MKQEINQTPPIGKFKHFKGIYIESTKEYYLCDFYETILEDGDIVYRVYLTLEGKEQVKELTAHKDGSWRFPDHDTVLPKELEHVISDCIIGACLPKK